MADENDVPEPRKYELSQRAAGLALSRVEPGDLTDRTDFPGATTSGLANPSAAVGPTPENEASVSSEMAAVVRSSTEPAVMTSGSSPGLEIVPGAVPRLPAAAPTTM